MRPFRDDTPTPDRVRATLQAALHPSFEDDAAAFAGADRWFERALARVDVAVLAAEDRARLDDVLRRSRS